MTRGVQLEAYARYHENQLNLLIHVATVPIVYVATGIALTLPFLPNWAPWWGVTVGFIIYVVLLQRFGHRLERHRAEKTSLPETIGSWVHEQFVIFPLFVITGGWKRNWRQSLR